MACYTLACAGCAEVAVKTASTSAAIRTNSCAAVFRFMCRVCLSTRGVRVEHQLLTMLQPTDNTENSNTGFDNSLQCKTRNSAVTLAGEITSSVKCWIGRETIFSDSSKSKFQEIISKSSFFSFGKQRRNSNTKPVHIQNFRPRNRGNAIQMI